MKTKKKDVFPATLQAARSLLEQWTNPNNGNNNTRRNNERKDKSKGENEAEEKRGAAFVQHEK